MIAQQTLRCSAQFITTTSRVHKLAAAFTSPRKHALGHFTGTVSTRPHLINKRSHTVRTMATSGGADFVNLIQTKNTLNPVIIYSKTYCPYCTEVKVLFSKLNLAPKIIELDQLADEKEVFAALKQVTNRSTVPQVFVGGKLVGGCDDTTAAFASGRLQQLLENAGVSYKQ